MTMICRLVASRVRTMSWTCPDRIAAATRSSGSSAASGWMATVAGWVATFGRTDSRRTTSTARRWVSMASQVPIVPRAGSKRDRSREKARNASCTASCACWWSLVTRMATCRHREAC